MVVVSHDRRLRQPGHFHADARKLGARRDLQRCRAGRHLRLHLCGAPPLGCPQGVEAPQRGREQRHLAGPERQPDAIAQPPLLRGFRPPGRRPADRPRKGLRRLRHRPRRLQEAERPARPRRRRRNAAHRRTTSRQAVSGRTGVTPRRRRVHRGDVCRSPRPRGDRPPHLRRAGGTCPHRRRPHRSRCVGWLCRLPRAIGKPGRGRALRRHRHVRRQARRPQRGDGLRRGHARPSGQAHADGNRPARGGAHRPDPAALPAAGRPEERRTGGLRGAGALGAFRRHAGVGRRVHSAGRRGRAYHRPQREAADPRLSRRAAMAGASEARLQPVAGATCRPADRTAHRQDPRPRSAFRPTAWNSKSPKAR